MPTRNRVGAVAGFVAVCLGVVGAPCVHAQVVQKVIDGLETVSWERVDGAGSISLSEEAAPTRNSRRSLAADVEFTPAARGFAIAPRDPLVVAGNARSVALWVKRSDPRCVLKVSFKDGWGRDVVADKPLTRTITPTSADDGWTRASVDVPAEWVSPVQITRISIDSPSELAKVRVQLDNIDVSTDITHVDPKTGVLATWQPDPSPANPKTAWKTAPVTKLVDVSISMPEQGNVFAGIPASATVRLRNWLPGAFKGTLDYAVSDADDKAVLKQSSPLEFESTEAIHLPLPADRFGLYTLDARMVDAGQVAAAIGRATYAQLPKPRELSEAEKIASPYGLNHYGNVGMVIKPFRKAGIVWIRDYGFGYTRILEGKGDGSFNNWPHFDRILKEFEEADLKVMPVLQKSIIKPKIENGKPVGPLGPNEEWAKIIGSVIAKYPQVTHWEMSNEYDLPADNANAEKLVNWENYGLYHAKLAELVRAVHGDKGVTIENGRAGIFPELEQQMVQSGHFRNIDVINSHYYTGTEPPEISTLNFNTHTDSFLYQEKGLLYDQLRAATRAGQSDGKKRGHWLTEFGWDTLAGPVVTPYEQAVFLQRAWLLALAAGCEKSFWFYQFDSKEPRGFFDGCGLFTHDLQPKMSLPAMAGMAWVLPSPKYVGMISAGDNTGGYVFRQGDKDVAVLFAIRGDGPEIEIDAEQLYDYFGNPISGKRVKLSMAPTYAVGLNPSSLLYRQSAYSLHTPHLISATPGDPIKPVVQIHNNRTTPIQCRIGIDLQSSGLDLDLNPITVAPGETKLVELRRILVADEARGLKTVRLTIKEDDHLSIKNIDLQVSLQPAIQMRVASISGPPGEAKLEVVIGNNAATPREGVLKLALPASWKADVREIPVSAIPPGESRTVPIVFTWSDDFKDDESAMVVFEASDETTVTRPLIPPQFKISAVSGISLDGDLRDWPAITQLPAWMLGTSTDEVNAKIHAGWTPEGLYFAVDVDDSKVIHRDPKSFWTGDVLELFVDTANNKQPRPFAVGEHQFWFVPLPDKGAVFPGQWKVEKEIAETQYDLPQVKGASRRTASGYVMEVFVPAAMLKNYDPSRGAIGINFNLTVSGQQRTREIYWPRLKASGVQKQQHLWGSMELTK